MHIKVNKTGNFNYYLFNSINKFISMCRQYDNH